LQADNQLPEFDRTRFQEAIVERAFAVSDTERETASQRLRNEGERQALLAIAARFAPDAVPALREIDDIEALRRAVDDALSLKLEG
jgi:hypothetical protein